MSDLSNDLLDYDYSLPEELIAQSPSLERDHSKLLIVRKNPEKGLPRFEDAVFHELPNIVRENEKLKKALWIRNRSFVIPARFYAQRPTGSKHEIVLVHPLSEAGHWKAIIRGIAKFKYPQELKIVNSEENILCPEADCIVFPKNNEKELLSRYGEMPLPPYIKDRCPDRDHERYQSVWANPKKAHSVAAPTASLHFTPNLLQELGHVGVDFADICLHVGLGTFQTLRSQKVDENKLHRESFEVSAENHQKIQQHSHDLNYLCVGSTALRCLESLKIPDSNPAELYGETDIFIKPGYQFKHCKALITNFHLPQSSLLILMSVFSGSRQLVLEAYNYAVSKKYRFFSYGDASLWI